MYLSNVWKYVVYLLKMRLLRDFGLEERWSLCIRSYGKFHSVKGQFVTDVSVQRLDPIFKHMQKEFLETGPTTSNEISVPNYIVTLNKIP
jgi:hypothetical protein